MLESFDSVVVEAEELLDTEERDEDLAFDLALSVGLELEHLGNPFVVQSRGVGVLLGLLVLGVVLLSCAELVDELAEETLRAGAHELELQRHDG